MKCTFDVDGNLLRVEHPGGWFSADHYHEVKGAGSRDFPMGSLQSSCAEYEHRTGHRGTLALIEAEKAAWMDSAERKALLKGEKPVEAADPVKPKAKAVEHLSTSKANNTNAHLPPEKRKAAAKAEAKRDEAEFNKPTVLKSDKAKLTKSRTPKGKVKAKHNPPTEGAAKPKRKR